MFYAVLPILAVLLVAGFLCEKNPRCLFALVGAFSALVLAAMLFSRR